MASEKPNRGSVRTPWRKRRTLRAIKQEAYRDREHLRSWDDEENKQTRLPKGETVHLGGLVLSEAFTPSTVSLLFRSLDRLLEDPREKSKVLEGLARSRRGDYQGWQNLGPVRRPGLPRMDTAFADAELPEGVEAVWLEVHYEAPSITVLVATFTYSEGTGDLSSVLRADHTTRPFDVQVKVHGHLGGLRSRMPWARPARFRGSYSLSHPADEKRRACEMLVAGQQRACQEWFYARFPGRFARAQAAQRPVLRLFYTEQERPFTDSAKWLEPVGLGFKPSVWRSTDPVGWYLSARTNGRARNERKLRSRRVEAMQPGRRATATAAALIGT